MTIKLDGVTATAAQKNGILSDLASFSNQRFGRGTKLVQIGDSNTDDVAGRPGWQSAVTTEWLGRGGWLYGGTSVNLGQNGSEMLGWKDSIASGSAATATTTRGSLWAAVNNAPDLIYFRLGTNDLIYSARRAAEGSEANLQANLDECVNFLLANCNATIMLVCPTPFGFGTTSPGTQFGDYATADEAATYSAQLRTHYRSWIGKHPRVIVFDTHQDLYGLRMDNISSEGIGVAGCDPIYGKKMMYDDLHENDWGYRVLSKYIQGKMTGNSFNLPSYTFPDACLDVAIWSETVYMTAQEVSGTLLSFELNPMRTLDGLWSDNKYNESNALNPTPEFRQAVSRTLVTDTLGAVYRINQMGGAANTLKAYCHASGKTVTMTSMTYSTLVSATARAHYLKMSGTGQDVAFDNGDIGPITFWVESSLYMPQMLTRNSQKETLHFNVWPDQSLAVAAGATFSYKCHKALTGVSFKAYAMTAPSGGTAVFQFYKNGTPFLPSNCNFSDGVNAGSITGFSTIDFAEDDLLQFYCTSNSGNGKGFLFTADGTRNIY